MINYLPLALLVTGGIILTIGDIIMKKWIESSNLYDFAIGLGVYLTGMLFLAYSFKYKNIAVASMLFVIFNIISLIAVSYYMFDEKLTTKQMIGIGLGLIVVVLLE